MPACSPSSCEPVRLVASLGLGQGQQDVAFLAAAVLREVAVDGGLGAFVGEVLAPALDVRAVASAGKSAGRPRGLRRPSRRGPWSAMGRVRLGVLRHENSWA